MYHCHLWAVFVLADKAEGEYMFVQDRYTCGNEKKSFLVFVDSMHRV